MFVEGGRTEVDKSDESNWTSMALISPGTLAFATGSYSCAGQTSSVLVA